MNIEQVVNALKNAGVNLATIGSEADRKARIEEIKKAEEVRVANGYTKNQIYEAVKSVGNGYTISNVTYNKLLNIKTTESKLTGSTVVSPVGVQHSHNISHGDYLLFTVLKAACSQEDLDRAMLEVNAQLAEEFLQTMKAQQEAYIAAQRPQILKAVESDKDFYRRVKEYITGDEYKGNGVISREDEMRLKKLVDAEYPESQELWNMLQADKQAAIAKTDPFTPAEAAQEAPQGKKK